MLYRSSPNLPLTKAEVYPLLSQARQANAGAQITGVLVSQNGHFVQVLEGPEANVRAVYARIQQDSRHTQVVTVSKATERPRHFTQWSMTFDWGAAPAVARLFEKVLDPIYGQTIDN